jgi:hypothetical protein
MLRLGMPEIHLEGVPHSGERWEHVTGRYQRIAGAFFPDVRAPARHCYLLSFSEKRVSPEDPRPEGPATRLRQWVIPGRALDRDQLRKQTWWLFGHAGPLRITLWRLARCPASAQAGG